VNISEEEFRTITEGVEAGANEPAEVRVQIVAESLDTDTGELWEGRIPLYRITFTAPSKEEIPKVAVEHLKAHLTSQIEEQKHKLLALLNNSVWSIYLCTYPEEGAEAKAGLQQMIEGLDEMLDRSVHSLRIETMVDTELAEEENS